MNESQRRIEELIIELEDLLGKDELWVYDHGSSGYKSIAIWGFAIMKEAVQWGRSEAYPFEGSCDYIAEKLRIIRSYLK